MMTIRGLCSHLVQEYVAPIRVLVPHRPPALDARYAKVSNKQMPQCKHDGDRLAICNRVLEYKVNPLPGIRRPLMAASGLRRDCCLAIPLDAGPPSFDFRHRRSANDNSRNLSTGSAARPSVVGRLTPASPPVQISNMPRRGQPSSLLRFFIALRLRSIKRRTASLRVILWLAAKRSIAR
jgi:hypothetical protein